MQLHKDSKTYLHSKNYFCADWVDRSGLFWPMPNRLDRVIYFDTMLIVLIFTGLLVLGYVALLLYYRNGWMQLPTYSVSATAPEPTTLISIIVPARNEAQHLPALLQSVAEQHYPRHLFELLLIDDFSTDDTAAIARAYDFVTVISLADYVAPNSINSYKKKAIEIGIQHSKGELLLTTDADCVAGKKWLRYVASYYENTGAQLMVMPVMFTNNQQPLGIFQLLDFMSLQGITGASVYKKMHSMCNGANLAYSKTAFVAVEGFKGIDRIASGDDMLLMHKIAKRFTNDIHYIKAPDLIVTTAPMPSISSFLQQRIRWASKADSYDDRSIFLVLLLLYVLNLLLLLIPVWLLFFNNGLLLQGWLCLLMLKTLAELHYLYPVAQFFGHAKQLWFFPLAQPFHIGYTVVAGWLGKFGKYQWKGRTVQ
jgi:cellulose synthase/poly-beta-1,6-N-acetylglucosamine synthase-like glycosyltransferase